MYSTKQYIKDTISFTNSLIIKFSGTAISINKGLETILGEQIDNADKYTHKYYLNLSGVKHHTNNDVKIKLLEDDLEYSLTKELLNNNLSTKNKLLEFKSYYKDLITKYPDDIDYIRGCILPVDIDDAINANDGTILSYSNHYIKYNELPLIRELNEYTQSFFTRWYIPEYLITDELYAASVVGSLITTIPSFILNARLKRVKTNEVHDFHLEHYFRSKLDIWEEVSILKRETIIWLYMNLDVIVKHIGKEETITTIANKVLDTNGVGIGVYVLKDGGQSIDDNVVPGVPYITKNENYLKITALNNSYSIHDNEKVSIDTTTELEVIENNALGVPDDKSFVLNDYIGKQLKNITVNSDITKVIDIDYGTIFKNYGNDLFLATMDTIYRTSKSGTYVNIITYTDPNTKKLYYINTLDGYYLILYHMLKLSGDNADNIKNISVTKSIRYNITIDELIKNIHDYETVRPIAEVILSFIPKLPTQILSIEVFNNVLLELRNLYSKIWALDSNVNNTNVSAAIKQMVNRLYVSTIEPIPNDGNLTEYLSENGVSLEIGETYDHIESIKAIYRLLTNNEISDVVKYNNNNDIMKSLISKLTSYTVNIISSVNDAEPIYSPYTSIQVYNSDNGLLVLEDASTVNPYETDHFYVDGSGDNFNDDIRHYSIIGNPNITYNIEQRVYAYNVNVDDVEVIPDRPVVCCEIVNSYKDLQGPRLTIAGDNMIVEPKNGYSEGIVNTIKVVTLQPDVVAYDTEPNIDEVDTDTTPSIIVTID